MDWLLGALSLPRGTPVAGAGGRGDGPGGRLTADTLDLGCMVGRAAAFLSGDGAEGERESSTPSPQRGRGRASPGGSPSKYGISLATISEDEEDGGGAAGRLVPRRSLELTLEEAIKVRIVQDANLQTVNPANASTASSSSLSSPVASSASLFPSSPLKLPEERPAFPKEVSWQWTDPVTRHVYSGTKVLSGRQDILRHRSKLPIFEYRSHFINAVVNNQVVVVVGETGSGKSTQMPQYLLESGVVSSGRIAVTQPRRVAAVSVAQRVADEVECRVGELVGYAIRFEDVTSNQTVIRYMTDGLLLMECLKDPAFSAYGCVILDEAHERTLHTDVLLGLLKKALRIRPELKVVITSATLDIRKFADYFSAPMVKIPGKMYPVTVEYLPSFEPPGAPGADPSRRPAGSSSAMVRSQPLWARTKKSELYVERAVHKVMQIHTTGEAEGDILVFLPGKEEVEMACSILTSAGKRWDVSRGAADAKEGDGTAESGVPPDCADGDNADNDGEDRGRAPKVCEAGGRSFVALPVYAALPFEAQCQIFNSAPPGVRKIIVATNIAETSLTIDGILYVVDTGLFKESLWDHSIQTLKVAVISRAQAEQRAGRAGRTAPGRCYRLYTLEDHAAMAQAPTPAIHRIDFTATALQLKAMGIDDICGFGFMDPPRPHAVQHALSRLRDLGALDKFFGVTDLGHQMSEFPLSPNLAKVLLVASEMACSDEVLTIVSMLSVNHIFLRPRGRTRAADAKKLQFCDFKGDHLTLLNVYDCWRKSGMDEGWARENYLNQKELEKAVDIRGQLLSVMNLHGVPVISSEGRQLANIRRALSTGLPHNVALRDPGQYRAGRNATYHTLSGDEAPLHIHPSSALSRQAPDLVIFNETVVTSRTFMRVVSVCERQWLPPFARRRVQLWTGR